MKNRLLLIAFLFSIHAFSQEITGKQLLEKAIKFHDPNGNWESFKGTFFVTMKTPEESNRVSEITIDLPKQRFSVKATFGKKTTEYHIDKDSIQIVFNGTKNPSQEIQKKNSLSTARAKMYQDYYTYLYGLPMKLKDPGTIIHEQVNLEKFMGDQMLVLKVTYSKEIGKDTWYFYFNVDTYKMEAYQFFHDEQKNDGEYILLDELETINGIKMPKNRAWYLNKNATYLGTDILSKTN
ncbi:MAG: hypothetical protein JKY44_03365 [Flavobacteriaceae bacterium]|nr:hypothetical protein [Flavobacteriaceae bacterium]